MKGELTDGPHNPPKNRLMARRLDLAHPVVRRLRKTGQALRVTLAGTRFHVDLNGTFHREPIDETITLTKESTE